MCADKKRPTGKKKQPAPTKRPARKVSKRKKVSASKTRATAKRDAGTAALRKGAIPVHVFNSGLEVWLYDDSQVAALREAHMQQRLIGDEATDGALVGYGLWQDDGIDAAIIVGPPLTKKELSIAAWLEPQTAFLRLPSGKLAVESNDACRIGEEDPTDKGAVVSVPKGNYRVTLYRVDHEALDREEREWAGPQEIIVLTPGGTPDDDAAGLLPFVERRDFSWVGAYQIDGQRFDGLVWFDDGWDTYFANLDDAAAEALKLKPGQYLRTTVPQAGVTLVTAYASTWKEGQSLPPPAGGAPDEFGYGAIISPERFEGKRALFCRRVKTKGAIPAAAQTVWLPATIEVLSTKPADPPARVRGPLLFDNGKRAFWKANLAGCTYFDDTALAMKLSDRLDGVDFDGTLTLAEAVERIDQALGTAGLTALGDFAFDIQTPRGAREYTLRSYGNGADCFVTIWASDDLFEVMAFTLTGDSRWVMTGTIDDDIGKQMTKLRPVLKVAGVEGALSDLVAQHRAHLKEAGGAPATSTPTTLEGLVRIYDQYLVAGVD